MSSTDAPLTGIRVVEMTEALAGPFCGMTLGDLGADVVKVERPGVGDQARKWGPPFLEGESAYFLSVNRNKRSVELDVKNDEDHDVATAARDVVRNFIGILLTPSLSIGKVL